MSNNDFIRQEIEKRNLLNKTDNTLSNTSLIIDFTSNTLDFLFPSSLGAGISLIIGIPLSIASNLKSLNDANHTTERLYIKKAKLFGIVAWVFNHPKPLRMIYVDRKVIKIGNPEIYQFKWRREVEKTWEDCDKAFVDYFMELSHAMHKMQRENGIFGKIPYSAFLKSTYKEKIRANVKNNVQELFKLLKDEKMKQLSGVDKVVFDFMTKGKRAYPIIINPLQIEEPILMNPIHIKG